MRACRLSEKRCHRLDDKSFKKNPDFWAHLLPVAVPEHFFADIKKLTLESGENDGAPGDDSDGQDPISELALKALVEAFPEVIPWEDLSDFPKRRKTPCVLGRRVEGASRPIFFS